MPGVEIGTSGDGNECQESSTDQRSPGTPGRLLPGAPHPELAGYVRKLWEQIGRKRNYVITGGKPEIWAGAVVYVIARLNFLFDRSNPNYLPPDVICDFFGTKKTTVSAKAAQIEKACRIRMGQEGLCSTDLSDSFTFVQLPSGMMLTKKIAKRNGHPRRIHGYEDEEDATTAQRQLPGPSLPFPSGRAHLYTLEVCIISGPIAKDFAKKNKVICRTIQICGDQTLEDLHDAIFEAFDREEQHMYEFQVGGKGPMDPNARRYVLPADMNDLASGKKPAGDVHHTTIESLGLMVGEPFGYWFDFGDDWWHQITVVAIEDKAGRGEFPKVIQRTGESPPQYVDWDEEKE